MNPEGDLAIGATVAEPPAGPAVAMTSLHASRSGDRYDPAFRPKTHEAIFRQFSRSMGRICPAWLADRRMDILQTAMLRTLEATRTDESERTVPASYLWKAVYTATVDEIRRIRRERVEPLEEAALHWREPRANSDPFRELSMHEVGRAVDECLGQLGQRRHLVVGLHLMGHSVGEMKRITGWGEKKVRNLLYRGLAELRRNLAAKGIAP
jgi:RNA polymerase sigma-70 factor (ECF subfamily)